MKKFLTFAYALLLLTGCQQPQISSSQQEAGANAAISQKQNPTIDVFLGLDKTGSATNNRIPQMSIEQVKPLLKLVSQQGGELRIATICDDSDRSMAKIQFDRSPAPPSVPTALPPNGTINSFKMAQLRRQHQQAESQYQTDRAAFDRAVQQRKTNNEGKTVAFLQQIKPTLEKTASCGSTDIVGVLQRGDLFLQEPGSAGSKKVALLITDGIHNISTAPVKLPWHNSAEVLTVSGGKGVGILSNLKPRSFESIDAAIRYIEGIN